MYSDNLRGRFVHELIAQKAKIAYFSAMADVNLKRALEAFGIKQSEFAQLVDVSLRTVSLWASGEKPLPGPVQGYLRLLALLPPETRVREFQRIKGRTNMLDDGVYSLDYRGENAGQAEAGDALAVLRNGRILGSDRWGGTFTGSYDFDAGAQSNTLHVRLAVPPGGMLVNGFSAGPDGATIEIVGQFDRAAPVSKTSVKIGGKPIDLQLTYIGPLPN
ncbi:MAG: hypothetical protein AAFV45_14200 [Pseudomonadota bacterium]